MLFRSSGSVIPRVDVSYQSELFTDPVNGPANRIDPRTLANARLSYLSEDRTWEIAAEVTNLFDKYYYENRIDNVLFNGQIYGYPGAPRRWAVTAKYNF